MGPPTNRYIYHHCPFCWLYTANKTGFIQIRISATKGNFDLTPDTYDVREVMAVLEQVANREANILYYLSSDVES